MLGEGKQSAAKPSPTFPKTPRSGKKIPSGWTLRFFQYLLDRQKGRLRRQHLSRKGRRFAFYNTVEDVTMNIALFQSRIHIHIYYRKGRAVRALYNKSGHFPFAIVKGIYIKGITILLVISPRTKPYINPPKYPF